jgi:hypothetical protein
MGIWRRPLDRKQASRIRIYLAVTESIHSSECNAHPAAPVIVCSNKKVTNNSDGDLAAINVTRPRHHAIFR